MTWASRSARAAESSPERPRARARVSRTSASSGRSSSAARSHRMASESSPRCARSSPTHRTLRCSDGDGHPTSFTIGVGSGCGTLSASRTRSWAPNTLGWQRRALAGIACTSANRRCARTGSSAPRSDGPSAERTALMVWSSSGCGSGMFSSPAGHVTKSCHIQAALQGGIAPTTRARTRTTCSASARASPSGSSGLR